MLLKFPTAAAFVALAALAIVPSVPAFASPDMKVLDPDGDGTVSMAEALSAGATKFKTADSDKDGTLDSKEAGMSVAGADTDKDGTLDSKEHAAAIESAFKAADTDNDGTLDAKELATPAGEKVVALAQ